jgi:hypothetical protein
LTKGWVQHIKVRCVFVRVAPYQGTVCVRQSRTRRGVTYFGVISWRISGTRYFQQPDLDVVKNRKIIAIGIPTYNEQRHELKRTLESLNNCVDHKLVDSNYGGQMYFDPVSNLQLEGYYTTALIVLDGVANTSESMQEYMEELFGAAFIQVRYYRAIVRAMLSY